jgi:transcriptional antiterminator
MNPAPSEYSVEKSLKHFARAYNQSKNKITIDLNKIELRALLRRSEQKEGAG